MFVGVIDIIAIHAVKYDLFFCTSDYFVNLYCEMVVSPSVVRTTRRIISEVLS